MNIIDEFIFEKIIWKSDMSQYGVIGLLTTPHEVISRMAGDCQGQAVTTTSLILSINSLDLSITLPNPGFSKAYKQRSSYKHSKRDFSKHRSPSFEAQQSQPMAFNAWVVETPFHWWTHASNNVTGQTHNLNYHGSAGSQGSVLPQPIDMIYTQPQKACTNCSWSDAHNNSPFLYIADPFRAFAIAWTGSHIFLRSNWDLFQVDWVTNILGIGLALAVLMTFYGSYLRDDFSGISLIRRFIVSFILGVGPIMTGLSFWTTVHYPVALLHLLGLVTFSLYFVARV
jgi:hypothetical protein